MVAALHGAFAFTEGHDATVGVGENLDFDVARLFQIFFEVEARVAEGVERFGGGVAPRRMPFPPPPETALSRTG